MISKNSKNECFVYITLPRETQSVTAGRLVLTEDRRGTSVGQFVYGRSYLSRNNAVEIDPVELTLREGTFRSAINNGLFNSLRDAGPDYWGRLVIERHSGRTGMTEIDYLMESPDDRAGALSFGLNVDPPPPRRKFNQTLSLAALQETADKLINEQKLDSTPESIQTQELILLGTSMGGARPKAVVEDDIGLWIAKFSRPDDRWNAPRVEHAMLELARKCGINSARSKIETVAGKDVLLVQRFDRDRTPRGYTRARMISGLTLLRAEESAMHRDRWSYVLMAEELRRVVASSKSDAEELFRRMCFNALISNIDDHPRNHALVAFAEDWHLSPAFDLTPSPSVSQHRDLALVCGDLGRFANAKNLLSQSSRFLLDKDEAKSILENMTEVVRSGWAGVMRAQGVSERDIELLKSAFVYEGFEQDV